MVLPNNNDDAAMEELEANDPLTKVPARFPATHSRFPSRPSRRFQNAIDTADQSTDELENFDLDSLSQNDEVRKLLALLEPITTK